MKKKSNRRRVAFRHNLNKRKRDGDKITLIDSLSIWFSFSVTLLHAKLIPLLSSSYQHHFSGYKLISTLSVCDLIWFYGSEMKKKKLTRKKGRKMTLSLWLFPQTHTTHITRSAITDSANGAWDTNEWWKERHKCADSRSFNSLTDDEKLSVKKFLERERENSILEQLFNVSAIINIIP